MLDEAFLSAARALVAADSVTERGNLRAVAVLEPLCREAGLVPRRLPAPDSGERDANLLAGPGGHAPDRDPPLLLVTHLDTVDPGPRAAWRTDPFELTIAAGRAHGLGVADVKLDALCKLWAASRLRDVRLKRGFWFLGTYGEEAGLRGAREFLRNPPLRPFAALCGEPCGLRLFSAHKGYAMVRVRLEPASPVRIAAGVRRRATFAGRSVHSSTPHLGVNAIDRALSVLEAAAGPVLDLHGGASTNAIPAECSALLGADASVGDASTPERGGEAVDLSSLVPVAKAAREAWTRQIAALSPARDERFEPACAVGSLTRIRTSAGGLELWLDARLLPQHDPSALLQAFLATLPALAGPAVRVTVAVERDAAGLSLPDDAPLVRRFGGILAGQGLDGRPAAKATSTEAGVFVRAGIPAIVFGATPSTDNAHTANEYALLEQVEKSIDVYEAAIRDLCG
jgi:acetylornithine deacetylase/succinyl-diaminopimelate desuccinylase-like protein